MDNIDRYTELFLEEATEHIEELNQNLLTLERDGFDPEVINEIFRTAHTLKSSAAFVGLDRLSETAHHMEDLLQIIKDGGMEVTTHLVNVFFQCLDRIKRVINLVAQGEKSEDDFQDIISELVKLSDQASPESAPAAPQTPAPVEGAEKKSETNAGQSGEESAEIADEMTTALALTPQEDIELRKVAEKQPIYDGVVKLDPEAPMRSVRFILLMENLKRAGAVFKCEPPEEELEGDIPSPVFRFIFYGEISREDLLKLCQVDMVEDVFLTNHHSPAELAVAGQTQSNSAVERPAEESRMQTRNIKVSADKIDYLMNNVGELVITNSGLQKIYEDLFGVYGDNHLLSELKSKIDGAARIARDLQSGIMKMRMIPVGLVFHRFTRPIRDLAQELGKETELVFQGEDTELDKNIIDALTDPLLHLLRNSLDHGIETADQREEVGKSRKATLTLNAYQGGNNIYIEVKDDGRGLNRDKILARAREREMIGEQEPATDDEIFNLIFQPGFSTAESVTDISGRGVGMNVVKNMIQKFNGSVRIQSEPGQGSAFILSFPLTLAIISAILVMSSGEEYAFPLSDVVENIKIHRNDITTLEGKDIFNLRGEILPIFNLSRIMRLPETNLDEFPVVIISSGNRKIGFIVDSLVGKKEIVIKSLDQNFHTVQGLIGACLMGDGRIVMVLDVQGLLALSYQQDNREFQDEESESLRAIRGYNHQITKIYRNITRNGQAPLSGQKTPVPGAPGNLTTIEAPPSNQQGGESSPEVAGGAVATLAPPAQEETTPEIVADDTPEVEDDTEQRLKAALAALEEDKKRKIHMAQDILVEEPAEEEIEMEISEEDYNKLHEIVNTGMLNAGLVLSQLLGVTVEVSVPELKIMDYSELSEYIPAEKLIAVQLNTEGDIDSMVLLVFDEGTGIKAAGDLMGLPPDDWTADRMPREDIESVLSELTNIVGASILNALANKTSLNIMPTVPTFIYGTADTLVDRIDSISDKGVRNYRIIYISADFYREDMELLGRLFLFLPQKSLMEIMGKL